MKHYDIDSTGRPWETKNGLWVSSQDVEQLEKENERLHSLLGNYPERAQLCHEGHEPIIHFSQCPLCSDEPQSAEQQK